jgi:peptidoglycan/xylan/chitin deacetylase (PgdA/CDA1 family)
MSDKSNRLKSVAPVENSEHLTGFSIDVVDKKDPKTLELKESYKSKAWEWIEANCGKYGFEISFPKGNKQGFNYEPWHLRYIGPEVPAELQLVFAYAKSGGNVDEATLDKVCKEAPKTESIEHTQEGLGNRTDLDLDRIVQAQGIDALTVITGKGFVKSKDADKTFSVASIIKLHVAEFLYKAVNSGSETLDKEIVLTPNILAENEPDFIAGQSKQIRFLLDKMLEKSSNTATNALVQHLGGIGNPINSKFSSLGYLNSSFNTYFSIPNGISNGRNSSTCYECARALFHLLGASFNLDTETGKSIMKALSKTEVPKGMRGIEFNKIGYNTLEVNANVAGYKNSKGYFIISAINNTGARDYDLTKIKEAVNQITEAIDALGIEGIDFTSRYSNSSTATPRSTTAKFLPVIMYHSIGNGEIDPEYARYEVTPAQFRGHMEHLKSLGYTAVLANNIISGDLPDKPIVITFDDGCLNNLTNAVPIMREFGMRGVFFITTDWIGKTHPEYKLPIMNSSQVASLVNGGHEVGSHGVVHRRSIDLLPHELEIQLAQSKNILSSMVGASIKSFSYPYGRTNARVIEATSKHYQLAYMAFMTSDNPGNSKNMINRVEIANTVTNEELQTMINNKDNFLKLN